MKWQYKAFYSHSFDEAIKMAMENNPEWELCSSTQLLTGKIEYVFRRLSQPTWPASLDSQMSEMIIDGTIV